MFHNVNRKIKRTLSVTLTLAACGLTAAAFSESTLEDRLAPVGDSCMSGDDCAAAPVAAGPSEPRSGTAVYDATCVTCHGTGAAGAPKFGDAAAWGPRVEQGVETLYTHALNGFNAMPAKGLCMDCSDDEVKAAVDHMVEAVQ